MRYIGYTLFPLPSPGRHVRFEVPTPVLELAILGLLKEQDLHGYELRKRLTETLGSASGASFGSLYPALRRLEKAGAVAAVDDSWAPSVVPSSGSLGGELAALRARRVAPRSGRSRKVYAITELGQELFSELLLAESQSSDDERTFNLRLTFARYLPLDARIGLLERRRAQLLERRTRLGSRARRRERLDDYSSSLIEHDREATEHDLSWIERLIARERDLLSRPASVEPAPPAVPTGAGRDVAAPSLSGFRPDHDQTGPTVRRNQEESIR
jgi:DNA-binding PadR family transcriptional regulator